MDAAAGKVLGKVPRLPPAPVQHGLGGVVQGVEGGHVVPLPAVGAEGAGAAHLTGRPVEDGGHVVVVLGRPEGGPHGVVQGAEGLGGLLQAALDPALGPAVRREGPLLLREQPGRQPPQGPLGQEEEGHRPQEYLVQDGDGQPLVPGPEDRSPVGQHIGQGGPQPAFQPKGPRRQAGQAVGHGVQGDPVGRQVQGQPHRHPQHRPGGGPPLPGGGEDHHHRQGTPQGDVLKQGQGGQGHEHRTGQRRQADPPLGGENPLPPAGAQGEEELPVAPAGGHGEKALGEEIDHILCPPPGLGQVDKAGDAVEQPGHDGHGPGLSQELHVVEGEVHRKGEHGGGDVPQPAGEAHKGQIAEAGPHQGRRPAHPRARRPHQGHPEGGVVPKDGRPRQHRRQQKVNAPVGEAQQGGGVHAHRLPPGRPPPQSVQLGPYRLLARHMPLLLCVGRPKCSRSRCGGHYIPLSGKIESERGRPAKPFPAKFPRNPAPRPSAALL